MRKMINNKKIDLLATLNLVTLHFFFPQISLSILLACLDTAPPFFEVSHVHFIIISCCLYVMYMTVPPKGAV